MLGRHARTPFTPPVHNRFGSLRPGQLALLAAVLVQPPAAHLRVWAVGDAYRIDPTSGKAYERSEERRVGKECLE